MRCLFRGVEKATSITASFETGSFYEASLRPPNDIKLSGERSESAATRG